MFASRMSSTGVYYADYTYGIYSQIEKFTYVHVQNFKFLKQNYSDLRSFYEHSFILYIK